jgi:hypothetical protein
MLERLNTLDITSGPKWDYPKTAIRTPTTTQFSGQDKEAETLQRFGVSCLAFYTIATIRKLKRLHTQIQTNLKQWNLDGGFR